MALRDQYLDPALKRVKRLASAGQGKAVEAMSRLREAYVHRPGAPADFITDRSGQAYRTGASVGSAPGIAVQEATPVARGALPPNTITPPAAPSRLGALRAFGGRLMHPLVGLAGYGGHALGETVDEATGGKISEGLGRMFPNSLEEAANRAVESPSTGARLASNFGVKQAPVRAAGADAPRIVDDAANSAAGAGASALRGVGGDAPRIVDDAANSARAFSEADQKGLRYFDLNPETTTQRAVAGAPGITKYKDASGRTLYANTLDTSGGRVSTIQTSDVAERNKSALASAIGARYASGAPEDVEVARQLSAGLTDPAILEARRAGEEALKAERDLAGVSPAERSRLRDTSRYHTGQLANQHEQNRLTAENIKANREATVAHREQVNEDRDARLAIQREQLARQVVADRAAAEAKRMEAENKRIDNERAANTQAAALKEKRVTDLTSRFGGDKERAMRAYDAIERAFSDERRELSQKKTLTSEEKARLLQLDKPGGPEDIQDYLDALVLQEATKRSQAANAGIATGAGTTGVLTGLAGGALTGLKAGGLRGAVAGASAGALAGGAVGTIWEKSAGAKGAPTNDLREFLPSRYVADGDFAVLRDADGNEIRRIHRKDLEDIDERGFAAPESRLHRALVTPLRTAVGNWRPNESITRRIRGF